MSKTIIRQGDVYLIKTDKLPSGAKRRKDRVLALGEVTGHSHRFEDEHAILHGAGNGMVYAELSQEATLIHEEHANIQIPKGIYEVRIQREYDVLEGVRRVMD